MTGEAAPSGRGSRAHLPDGTVLRANPEYELHPLERLPADVRRELRGDRDVYGVLRGASGSGLPTTVVSPDTALLWLTLRQPGPVPAYVAAEHGAEAGHILAQLVLDELLQVQVGGEFVTGARALAGLAGTGDVDVEHPLARLSVAALRYAEALPGARVPELTARLYCYHREPASPRWVRRLPTRREVARFLGVEGGATVPRQLGRCWDSAATGEGWLHWRFHDPGRPRSDGADARYKLYLSPVTEALPDVFPVFVDVVTDLRAPAFKVGADLPGLLRPDKLVAYFPTYEALAAAAHRLGRYEGSWPAQGVPFTGAIDRSGLISWGLDPPRTPTQPAASYPADGSWRLWVASRLAQALCAARRTGDPAAPAWRFALERVRAAGVDPATWAPAGDVWSA